MWLTRDLVCFPIKDLAQTFSGTVKIYENKVSYLILLEYTCKHTHGKPKCLKIYPFVLPVCDGRNITTPSLRFVLKYWNPKTTAPTWTLDWSKFIWLEHVIHMPMRRLIASESTSSVRTENKANHWTKFSSCPRDSSARGLSAFGDQTVSESLAIITKWDCVENLEICWSYL